MSGRPWARPEHGARAGRVNGAVLRFGRNGPSLQAAMPDPLPPYQAAVADRAQRGARAVVLGMALNALLGLIKIAGGVLGHAYALVADGAESMCDCCFQVHILMLRRLAASGACSTRDSS